MSRRRRPPSTGESLVPIRAALDGVLGRLGSAGSRSIEALFDDWLDVAGPLGEHCRPTSLDKGRLQIVTTDSALASELQWRQNELIEQLRSTVPGARIEEISVRVERDRGVPGNPRSRW